MKFSYRREPIKPNPVFANCVSILRPRIRVRLFRGGRFVDLLALVDSGADECMFPLEVAQDLDLPLDPQRGHQYRGVGKGSIMAYFAEVVLDIAGARIPIFAGFSDSPSIVPILGQRGFFDSFEVKFNRSKEAIELKLVNP